MTDAWKGMQASLLLHAAVFTCVWAAGVAPPRARAPLVIDLTIGGPWETGGFPAQAPAEAPRRTARAVRQPSPPAIPPPPAPATPVNGSTPEPLPAPPKEATPVAATPAPPDRQDYVAAPGPPGPAGGTERTAASPPSGEVFPQGTPTARAATGAGAGALEPADARARGRYLERNYAYIRDAIQQGIAYPSIARRMGWEGRVVVTFLVLSDGSVRDVRVVKGSGHPALDRGAVEAVRNAAPFPKPPAQAEIITPVVYRLD